MIERPRSYIALPLSNADRKRAYLIRLVSSPAYDEQSHSWRVADGLVQLRRLQGIWRRKARERSGLVQQIPRTGPREVLTLRRANG